MKLIITEKNTIEGITAGWVASRLIREQTKWIQVERGDRPPAVDGYDVLMFGVCFSRQVLKYMEQKATSIIVYDNDPKSRIAAGGLKFVHIQNKKTPARMAWNYLRGDMRIKVKGQEMHFISAPWIVDYTEDKTEWPWPNIRPYFVRLAIAANYKPTLESWDELASRDLSIVEQEGLKVAKDEDLKRDELAKKQEKRELIMDKINTGEELSADEKKFVEEDEELARRAGGEAVTSKPKQEEKKDDGKSTEEINAGGNASGPTKERPAGTGKPSAGPKAHSRAGK